MGSESGSLMQSGRQKSIPPPPPHSLSSIKSPKDDAIDSYHSTLDNILDVMTLVFDEINLMELWPVDFCNANRFISQDFPLPVIQRRWMEDARSDYYSFNRKKKFLHACRFSHHNPINNCLVRHQTFISDCLALDTREWVDGLMGETSSIVSTCGSSIHSHQTSHKDKHKPKPPTTPFGPTALARKASRAHIVAQTPNPRSNENLIYSISHTGINILV